MSTLDWMSASLRTYRTVRDAGWWLRLSARDAALEAVDHEAARLTAELATAGALVNGRLRQSLSGRQT